MRKHPVFLAINKVKIRKIRGLCQLHQVAKINEMNEEQTAMRLLCVCRPAPCAQRGIRIGKVTHLFGCFYTFENYTFENIPQRPPYIRKASQISMPTTALIIKTRKQENSKVQTRGKKIWIPGYILALPQVKNRPKHIGSG